MNTRHNDILNAISRMMWLSTSGVAEAIEPLGYGGGTSWNEYRDMISKDLGYLQKKGLIKGEDRPQTKGKPVRYWSLSNPQSECQSAEMASDVAKAEATHKESLTVEMTPKPVTTPSPPSVEVRVTPKITIPVGEAIAEYASYRWGEKESYLEGFLYGIAFAERYHNIFDAD